MKQDKSQSVQPSSSLKISEIILKTSRYAEMKAWYADVLGVSPFYEQTPPEQRAPEADKQPGHARELLNVCFFRVSSDYPYTQAIGIFEDPAVLPKTEKTSPGLHHMQLMTSGAAELSAKYLALKALGKRPHRCMDHGMITSFYYLDPDGNNVEVTMENFPTFEAMVEFMSTPQFKNNPSGHPVDPEAFAVRAA